MMEQEIKNNFELDPESKTSICCACKYVDEDSDSEHCINCAFNLANME